MPSDNHTAGTHRLAVIAQEPSPGEARVRLPKGADIPPAERDHAIGVIMSELGAESRETKPETVVGEAIFNGEMFVEFDRSNSSESRPATLAEFAADGGEVQS